MLTPEILGALFVGLITGAIVMGIGVAKDEFGLGLGGFFACVVSGLILGLLLAIPVTGLFSWLILKRHKEKVEKSKTQSETNQRTLSRLLELKDQGIISEQEFNEEWLRLSNER